jgi:TM2 domain-containing membrane protein YozV
MDQLPDLTYRSSIRYWKKPTLDYNFYWILTVFLGWAGLDYFYLGSPWMGFVKLAMTFLTLGYWWAYDALNATFNKEQVEFAGPFVPAWGPTGIGAGRFASKERPPPSSPEQAAKHTHFLLYGIALFTLGIFGADSYLTGDTMSGFIRLISLLTIIFSPIAILWYIFNVGRYVIRTDLCMDTFWDYFGAPKPADGQECPNVLEMFTIWVLKTLVVILKLIPGMDIIVSSIEGVINSLETAYKVTVPIVKSTVETGWSITSLIRRFYGMLRSGFPAPTEFAAAAAEAGGPTATAAKPVASAAAKSSSPAAAAASPAPAAASSAPAATQTGGGFTETPFSASLSLLSVAVVGTILVSAVSLTFWRAYQKTQNGSVSPAPESPDKRGGEEYNDVPPHPTLSGESGDD